MPLKAILFDFDFTLADSSVPVVTCITHALASAGHPVPDRMAIERTIGLSLTETFAALSPNGDPDLLSRYFIAKADEVMVRGTEIFPEVSEAVTALAGLGLKLGIVSTKFRFRLDAILARYGLDGRFELVLGHEDVSRTKPDPEGLMIACRRLAVKHGEALYVGDSLVDAEAAARAGIRFMAVLHGRTLAEEFVAYRPLAILPDLLPLIEMAGEYINKGPE